MRIKFWYAHVYLILVCACISHFVLRRLIFFCSAQAHPILFCVSASQFVLHRRISFCSAQTHSVWCAHVHILFCSAQAHLFSFVLRRRTSFYSVQAHPNFFCTGASYFVLCKRTHFGGCCMLFSGLFSKHNSQCSWVSCRLLSTYVTR